MPEAAAEKITFSFGKNWQEYVEHQLTPEREGIALKHLKDSLARQDLRGLAFLDVGCGSGLFSLAAYRLGAERIISLDVDPFSVQCCQELRARAGQPAHWQVRHGSILDAPVVAGLDLADVVYAWGSLHHTGKMWEAIRNAGSRVRPGGTLFLSIYNRVQGRGSSEYWLRIKKLYNRSSAPVKRLMEVAYSIRHGLLPQLLRLRNPARYFREYQQQRGMSFWIDAKDWLGGYPYEYADTGEILRFCSRELNMELLDLNPTNTTGTNEFRFRRKA